MRIPQRNCQISRLLAIAAAGVQDCIITAAVDLPDCPHGLERATLKTGNDITRTDSPADAERALLPHLRWELTQVMTRVQPDDLSNAEIAALLAILRPALTRIVGGPTSGPRLRLV